MFHALFSLNTNVFMTFSFCVCKDPGSNLPESINLSKSPGSSDIPDCHHDVNHSISRLILCLRFRFISLAVKSSSSFWSSTPTRSTFSTGLWIAATQGPNSSPRAASRQSQQSVAAGITAVSSLSHFCFFPFLLYCHVFLLFHQQELRKWHRHTAKSGPLQGIGHQQRNLRDFNAAYAGKANEAFFASALVFCNGYHASYPLNRSWKLNCLHTLRGLQSRSQVASCMALMDPCLLCTVCLCHSCPANWQQCILNSHFHYSQVDVCCMGKHLPTVN